MTALYYRADKRRFALGDTIATAGEFSDRHPAIGKLAEELLESRRPAGKLERFKCLMLFEDLSVAKDHWIKMDGGILYGVQADGVPILHRGDMQLVDQIGRALADGIDATGLAEAYWRSQMTPTAYVEVLLLSATVAEVISDDQRERRDRLRERWGMSPAPKTARELKAESDARLRAKQQAEREV